MQKGGYKACTSFMVILQLSPFDRVKADLQVETNITSLGQSTGNLQATEI